MGMGCGNNIYKSGCNPTKELVEQLVQQIATRSVRDSDLDTITDLTGDELVAVVHNGRNVKITVNDLLNAASDLLIRIGTTEYWNNDTGYIPDEGTIIIYSDHGSVEIDGETVAVPAIKIGSGNGYVQDLAFVGQDYTNLLLSHIGDTVMHVTPEEKAFWNNKLNVTDNREVVDETLIFHRN